MKQNGLIDIHSHLLPFLDDGAKNYDQCLRTAILYRDAGFERVVATPHCIQGTKWTPSPDRIISGIRDANTFLEKQDITLTILSGMEIMVTDLHCEQFDSDQFLSMGGSGFFLIEFPLQPFSGLQAEKAIERLLSIERASFVVAHPERCAIFNDNLELIQLLVNRGMLLQVNIDSLLGRSGKKVQRTAAEFLQAGLVHFLASDTHAEEGRMPPDGADLEKLIALLGREATYQALKFNPQALLAGKKVDPVISNGNIQYSAHLHARQGGYMQKLKKLFHS